MIFLALPAAAQVQTPQSRASLISEKDALSPGQPVRVGLLLEHAEGWHTYWENPGDAGLATEIQWQLPAGFATQPIDWPTPARKHEGELGVFSYSGALLLPVTLSAPADLPAEDVELKAKASWLICKDICIPESAELSLHLPVAASSAPSAHAGLFAAHDAQRPQTIAASQYRVDASHILLQLPTELTQAAPKSAFFFLREPNLLNYAAEQTFASENGAWVLKLPRQQEPPANALSGILEIIKDDGTRRAYRMEFTPATAAPATTPPATAGQPSTPFLLALVFAFLGGLVLNLMPCVLPVLSLKALAVVGKSGKTRSETLGHGLAYSAGILLSFALIGGLLIALQQAGQAVGWGYQMQSPVFVGFLIFLLFLVGLSLSGIFYAPSLFGHIAVPQESSLQGSFATGILATAVATPCTAPFMATAVGAALLLPPAQALMIFLALGFGLALPFLLISIFPASLRFLPKPGVWMEHLKELLAFGMYGSVVWLLWVLTQQAGATGLLVMLVALLLVVFVLWLRRLFTNESLYRVLALTALVGVVAWSLGSLSAQEENNTPTPPASASMHGEAFSQSRIDALRAQGKAVLVDATAAWCITCQVNKRVLLSDEVQQLFKEKNVTLMVADWTRRNPEITAWLASFGYQGVPLYVYYPAPEGTPVVLPQLLTTHIIESTLQ